MTLSLEKLLCYYKKEESLSSSTELYEQVGLPTTNLEQQWTENHNQLLTTFQEYHHLYSEWRRYEQL